MWDEMEGEGSVRFCKRCQRRVYDFDEMELSEAENLIFRKEGRLNVTLYKRQEGKFLSNDCPVGVRRRQSIILFISAGIAVVTGIIVLLLTLPQSKMSPVQVNASVAKKNQPVCHSHSANSSRPIATTKISPDDSWSAAGPDIFLVKIPAKPLGI